MGGLISAKFLVVLAIALIVLGPDKLPEAARTLGRWLTEIRRVTTGFTEEVKTAFESSELAEPVQELRSATQSLRATTMEWRGAATGWITGAGVAGPGSGGAPSATAAGGLPSDTTWSPGPASGPGSGVAPAARAGSWGGRPEAELGIPPGDPSLN